MYKERHESNENDLWKGESREVKEFGVKIVKMTVFSMNSSKRKKMEAELGRDMDLVSVSDARDGKMNLLIGKMKQYVTMEVKAVLEKRTLEPSWKERLGNL